MAERLQKIIAAAGLCSRRTAEEWIRAGRVTVNGEMPDLGCRVDPAVDEVLVDGRPLPGAAEKVTLLLNKPTGCVTTVSDPQGRRTVLDLLPPHLPRLFPVGRLDYNTEGLLLLTNDGELAQHLAHPRHKVEKTYLVRVRGAVTEEIRRKLERGVALADGITAPAGVRVRGSSGGHGWLEITIREGRNRQIRRMCEAVGLSVSRLKRIRLGFLDLGDLPTGKTRILNAGEIDRLKSL
ncbi:pseudouridine synthase [Geothermobacter hydrogeniphilus]|uniref:Pseudouridine synthase n=1 Tax=Geothermobacter hydrogeniphilus TaxID=1969733 RepID=A0A2K2HCD6_9BACT|nr:pseudouridine synthase [Geothermobacter hydrogeniphilus]PNU20954.1 pseudouridine synthase [Geothermobacter hydrogeniphilus]